MDDAFFFLIVSLPPLQFKLLYLLQNKYFVKYSLKYTVNYSLKHSHTIHVATWGPRVLPAVFRNAVEACFPGSQIVALWSPRLT